MKKKCDVCGVALTAENKAKDYDSLCEDCQETVEEGRRWSDQDHHINDPDHPDYHGPIRVVSLLLGVLITLVLTGCTMTVDMYWPSKDNYQQRETVHSRVQGMSNLEYYENWRESEGK